MFLIKNISNNKIILDSKTLYPNDEYKTSDLKSLSKAIDLDYIEITKIKDHNDTIYENYLNKNKNRLKLVENKFINNDLKDKLVESFFNYHFNEFNEESIRLIKWFYKQVGFTKDIENEILNLIDDVENYEELTEVLLNNIYPSLLDLYLINEFKEENN